VPKDPGYRPTTRDLARIDESFRDTKPGNALDIRFDLVSLRAMARDTAGNSVSQTVHRAFGVR
jgi:hypothetical protein